MCNSYYCRFGCWLEREHGYFQDRALMYERWRELCKQAAHFRNEFQLTRSSTFVVSVWVLWGMNLATRIWNLLSFMKENLHVPFMCLDISYHWCQILWTMSGYWIQFFHLENWPGQSLIWVLSSGRASVWEWLLPLSTCVGQGPNRRQRPHGNMKRKC